MILLLFLPILLILFEELISKKSNLVLGNIVAYLFLVGLAYALGSRCIGCAVYDDYANVYLGQGRFLETNGFSGFFSQTAVTQEYLFYVIYYIIVKIVPELYWLATLSFISLFFLYRGLRIFLEPNEALVVIAFASIGLSTQLIRQYIAWSVMFYILVSLKKSLKIWFLAVPFFIHHSSIFLAIKWSISKVLNWKWILFIGIIGFLLRDSVMKSILGFNYYSIQFLSSTVLEGDILNYNRLFLNRIYFLLFAILFVEPRLKSFVLTSVLVYTLLFDFPLIPVRLNLLLLSHGVGIAIITLLNKFKLRFSRYVYAGLLLIVVVRLMFNNNGDFALWTNYSMII